MKPTDLSQAMNGPRKPLLLHVLPEEVFGACRIPGSHNACVYETAFLDHVASISEDRAAPVVVYGAGAGSCDAETAAAKLLAAGFTDVGILEGGFEAWRESGLPCEGDGDIPEPRIPDGIYQISATESLIRWTGRNPFNQHHGTIGIASGEIRILGGSLQGARFVIDMNSIACEDLTDAAWNTMLIRHLRDADFFDVENFPTAGFVATSAEAISGCTNGTANFLLKGDLTLRGVTHAIGFPVVVASADGRRLTGQGQFEFDRTEFGSIYGSGKFFRFLGKHVVNDMIHLDVLIRADQLG